MIEQFLEIIKNNESKITDHDYNIKMYTERMVNYAQAIERERKEIDTLKLSNRLFQEKIEKLEKHNKKLQECADKDD